MAQELEGAAHPVDDVLEEGGADDELLELIHDDTLPGALVAARELAPLRDDVAAVDDVPRVGHRGVRVARKRTVPDARAADRVHHHLPCPQAAPRRDVNCTRPPQRQLTAVR